MFFISQDHFFPTGYVHLLLRNFVIYFSSLLSNKYASSYKTRKLQKKETRRFNKYIHFKRNEIFCSLNFVSSERNYFICNLLYDRIYEKISVPIKLNGIFSS